MVVSLKALRSNQSVGANQFMDITPSRNICRNLFGAVDHEGVRKDIEKHRREHAEDKKREYNFDFENEKPLEAGRYLWEKLPSTFLKSFSGSNRSESSRAEKPLVSEAETASCTNSAKIDLLNASGKIVENENHKITDFFRAKKRKLSDEFLVKEGQEATCSQPHTSPR